jgi:YidC/Oxa1 family membrane protein insertase
MLGFLNAPLGVAYDLLFTLAHLLAPLPGGLATVAAIVIFTVAVRLLLSPLSFTALRGQAGIAALQSRVAELRTRYVHQPDRLQRELAALYQAQGGTLLAGCLPLLVQLPFFSVLYRLFLSRTVAGRPNALLAKNLLGAPLGSHWLTGLGPLSLHGLVFIGLFALLALACFAVARLSQSATRSGPVPGAAASGTRLAGLLGRVLPYTTVIIAAFVPLAAGLYLLTTTAWTAAERAVWRHRSGRPGQIAPSATAG